MKFVWLILFLFVPSVFAQTIQVADAGPELNQLDGQANTPSETIPAYNIDDPTTYKHHPDEFINDFASIMQKPGEEALASVRATLEANPGLLLDPRHAAVLLSEDRSFGMIMDSPGLKAAFTEYFPTVNNGITLLFGENARLTGYEPPALSTAKVEAYNLQDLPPNAQISVQSDGTLLICTNQDRKACSQNNLPLTGSVAYLNNHEHFDLEGTVGGYSVDGTLHYDSSQTLTGTVSTLGGTFENMLDALLDLASGTVRLTGTKDQPIVVTKVTDNVVFEGSYIRLHPIPEIPGAYREEIYSGSIQYQCENGVCTPTRVGEHSDVNIRGLRITTTDGDLILLAEEANRPETTDPGPTEMTVAARPLELVFPPRGWFRQGDRGSQVETLQTELEGLGHYKLGIDGAYGPGTTGAVVKVQEELEVTPDGAFGPATLAAYNAQRGSQTVTVESDAILSVQLPEKGYFSIEDVGIVHSEAREAQEWLVEEGFLSGTGREKADGRWGSISSEAMRRWQIAYNKEHNFQPSDPGYIEPTGNFDRASLSAINNRQQQQVAGTITSQIVFV